MRKVIGGVLGLLAGGAMGYGIASVVTGATSCVDGAFSAGTAGADPTGCVGGIETSIPIIVVGSLVFMVSVVLWWGAWVTGPLTGLAAAGWVLVDGGIRIDPGLAAFVAACTLLGPAILVLVSVNGSRKRAKANRLVATGQRGVAQIQAVEGTGVYINHQPQVRVRYLIHPLDGSGAFEHTKTQTIGFGSVQPRPGLAWPAWYDPADRGDVAVGAPSGLLDAQTQATLREFGIAPQQALGYDPGAATVGSP
jgi:hypothetical protein